MKKKKEIQWKTLEQFKKDILFYGSRLHVASESDYPVEYSTRGLLFQKSREIFGWLNDEQKKSYGLKASSFLEEDVKRFGGIHGCCASKVVPWDQSQLTEMVKMVLDYTFSSRVGSLSYGECCQIVGSYLGWRVGFRGRKTELRAKIDYLLNEGNEHFRNIMVGAIELAFVESQANLRPCEPDLSLDDTKAVWEELNKPAVVNEDIVNLRPMHRQREGGPQ